MASLLRIYQETEGVDDEQLAAHLGLAVDRLPILALCREPRGDAPFFRQDIAEIADYTGTGVTNLAMFVRAAQGLRRMRASSDRSTGYLAAARDAETSTEEP